MSTPAAGSAAPDPPAKIAFLHTVASLAETFARLAADELGAVDVVHLVDENLLRDTIEFGLLPRTIRRVAAYAAFAEESGARAVLVTCSSIGEAAELARAQVGIPVLRVDEPMAAEAAATGERIGVVATLSSTLEPTAALIRRAAARAGADRTVVTEVCAGAFTALRAGDTDAHDRLVADGIARAAAGCDVVVLAQASMARCAPPALPVPVLTSPRSGVRQLRCVLGRG